MLGRMTMPLAEVGKTSRFFTFTGSRSILSATSLSSTSCPIQSRELFGTSSKRSNNPLKESMPVVLLENIARGLKGEIISVPKGYARNFLLPTKKAVVATRSNIQQYSITITDEVVAMRHQMKQERLARRRIPKLIVEVKRQVLPDGSLHSNVTADVIVEKAIKQFSFPIEPSTIDLPAPISALGLHEVPIRLGEAVVPLKVSVVKR